MSNFKVIHMSSQNWRYTFLAKFSSHGLGGKLNFLKFKSPQRRFSLIYIFREKYISTSSKTHIHFLSLGANFFFSHNLIIINIEFFFHYQFLFSMPISSFFFLFHRFFRSTIVGDQSTTPYYFYG